MRRLLLVPLLLAACSRSTSGLFRIEVAFLEEDVVDLVTVVFQGAENAFVGDAVEEADVVEPAGPGNAFTATYDLPERARTGLGFGSGRVALRVTADGAVDEEPLSFSFATTTALAVVRRSALRYGGEARLERIPDVDLVFTLTATRASAADPFLVETFVEGDVLLGITFPEIRGRFGGPGRPRDGIGPGCGDAEGCIDDPEVEAGRFDFDLDWINGERFRAEGEVGRCCFFRETFLYGDVL
mgnify:CR=1 FL=1